MIARAWCTRKAGTLAVTGRPSNAGTALSEVRA
jgi:hypothetical protein